MPIIKATEKRTFVHLNGHQLCVMDVETTGLRAGYHEIIQISVVPLNSNLDVLTSMVPFDVLIRPEHPDRAEDGAIRQIGQEKWRSALHTGMDSFAAFSLFEEWFNRFNLPEGKRLTPLAHNWTFDREFIREWMLPESFNYYIDYHFRDTFVMTSFINDRCDMQGKDIMFPKQKLGSICKVLEIEVDNQATHDSLYDCHLTRQIYQKLTKEMLI